MKKRYSYTSSDLHYSMQLSVKTDMDKSDIHDVIMHLHNAEIVVKFVEESNSIRFHVFYDMIHEAETVEIIFTSILELGGLTARRREILIQILSHHKDYVQNDYLSKAERIY